MLFRSQRTVTATTVQTNNAVRGATQAALKTTALPVTAENAPLISDLQLGAKISGKNRSFLEQLTRNQKAKALRQERIARDIRNAEIAALPKPDVNEQLFKTTFDDLLPQKAFKPEEIPLFPFLENEPGFLYRGLALPAGGDELQHIFEEGLLLQDVGPYANTRLMAMPISSYGMARELSKPLHNFTSSPSGAAEWALKRSSPEKPLLVVVQLSGQAQQGAIVHIARDIKPKEFNVFALVEVKGTPTWCKVLYSPYGHAFIPLQGPFRFTLTPYK